jgi:hypothetical protein
MYVWRTQHLLKMRGIMMEHLTCQNNRSVGIIIGIPYLKFSIIFITET